MYDQVIPMQKFLWQIKKNMPKYKRTGIPEYAHMKALQNGNASVLRSFPQQLDAWPRHTSYITFS